MSRKYEPENLPSQLQGKNLSLAARRAWSGDGVSETFRDTNLAHLSTYVNSENPVKVAPTTDALVLGICMSPDIYETMTDWIKGHTFEMSKRVIVTRGNIMVDGRQAGKIVGSRANMTRYGKQLNFNFMGTWFRDTRDGDGCGLNEAHAFDLMHHICKFMVAKRLVEPGFVRFHTIARWDVVLELWLKRSGLIRPVQLARGIQLPYGVKWNVIDSNFQKGEGETIYASSTSNAKKTRSSHPHICMYQKADALDSIRIELRVPNLRNVDPENSFGQASAAHYISQMLNCFSPYPLRVAEANDEQHRKRDSMTVKALNFSGAPPEDWVRRPYSGHPGTTTRRMARTGMTLFTRSVQALLVANLLTSSATAYAANASVNPLREELDVLHARQPTEEGWTQYDVVEGELLPHEARPGDHGYTLEQIADHVRLNLDELYHMSQLAEWYRQRYHPDSKPFWVAKREQIKTLRLPPDLRLLDKPTLDLVRETVESEEHYLQRYLDPTCHEPLQQDRSWTVSRTEKELLFWAPDRDHEVNKPDLKMEL